MKEQVKQLRKEGKTYKEICEITGLSKGTISYHLNDDLMKRALARQKQRRKNIKKTLVDYKGGKCEKCGYNRYQGALEFHHIDPKEKEFMIGVIHSRSIDNIKVELDKCILLCANCHKEIHASIA